MNPSQFVMRKSDIEFETVRRHEVLSEAAKQDVHQTKYWSIRQTTNLPEAFWNMAWVHVSQTDKTLINYSV